MCVKEFFGFVCGHCSIPYLRQCPLTQSNCYFRPCRFPAERSIFTNENCHACARVLWNIRVLKNEEAHHNQHRRGECACEFVFDEEERKRRHRPRSPTSTGNGRSGYQARNFEQGGTDGSTCDNNRGNLDRRVHHRNLNLHSLTDNSINTSHQAHCRTDRILLDPIIDTSTYQHAEYLVSNPSECCSHQELASQIKPESQQNPGYSKENFAPEEYLWEQRSYNIESGGGTKWYPQKYEAQAEATSAVVVDSVQPVNRAYPSGVIQDSSFDLSSNASGHPSQGPCHDPSNEDDLRSFKRKSLTVTRKHNRAK